VFHQDKCVLCLKCIEACPQHTLGDLTRLGREKKKEAVPAGA
jgi:NAD-dependent dihydropyrimidine dehydrogenase PreA subunit